MFLHFKFNDANFRSEELFLSPCMCLKSSIHFKSHVLNYAFTHALSIILNRLRYLACFFQFARIHIGQRDPLCMNLWQGKAGKKKAEQWGADAIFNLWEPSM